MKNIFVLCVGFFCFNFCKAQVTYEFRGVWVATVVNIDWPSKVGLSSETQKAEFIHILNMNQRNGMNAMLVQVRPSADAFYESGLEPWSEYLSGHQGKAPEPFYDPLKFMIEETHKRGMEFHAWLNPYRAVFNIHSSSISPTHITKQHPTWFLNYGTVKYFNPGLPQVRAYVASVVKDIVARYDIDGIHMDDYFYPYRIDGKTFPDAKTFNDYGGGMNREDWRRSNCDSIIKLLYETIRSTKPYVRFGISPFGVWRNKSQDAEGSNTRAGQTNYDDLYADILLWLKKGWIDYVAPQLYWVRGHHLCDYDTLLAWWNAHAYGRQLYIGHALEFAGTTVAWRNKHKEELPTQIAHLREYETTQGSIFFSSSNFEHEATGINDSLQLNYYSLPAIPPPMKWIDSIAPPSPIIKRQSDKKYSIVYEGKKAIKGFGVFILPDGVDEKQEYATLVQIIVTSSKAEFDRNKSTAEKTDRIFIAAIDRNNNVSSWVELK